jgi:Uma2 family endonuclease
VEWKPTRLEWPPEGMTVEQFLRGPETLRRRELLEGHLREPPAPFWSHQSIVTRLVVLLDAHVRSRDVGRVCVSPVDVILNSERALILQPDLLFVSHERMSIVRKQVWGAPDLVVEVLSTATERRDCTKKVRWYRRYGTRECWLVYPRDERIQVLRFDAGRTARRSFRRGAIVASAVLPGLTFTPADVFDL